ncbi:GET complex subunit GET2 [Penicillium cf. griseofulvum]|uniref:GET complex subunit GET2 n=1 Tax=Penicillium cf. griseofulvum TaxID=2972120 RepID=A0A9W9T1E7_9EURO|nr:GET complex subunit GET2 [Penicillium cf. griseofulvum]KAJ5441062.1 GET complex subunit GET2 [Penicillium cf. griseofulvum]
MADESPAQRSARLRRERREAKIKEGGSARLDKITSLSGRTPQTEREEASPSPQPQRAISASPSPGPQNPQFRSSASAQPDMQIPEAIRAQQEAFFSMLRQSAPEPGQGLHPDPQAPNSLQAQQEAFRAMLRQAGQDQGQGQPPSDSEDPTIKLLNSLMGAIPGGDPNALGGAPLAGAGNQPAPGFSLAAIASMLGVPPFIANMLGGATPPTEAEQKRARVWKTMHTVFALSVAVYLLFIIGSSVALFGSPPPKPAAAQNPFTIFVTGELLLTGSKVLLDGKLGGMGMAVQLFRDVVRDGSLLLFILGMGTWYNREWQTTA